jgi:hypothetical protein
MPEPGQTLVGEAVGRETVQREGQPDCDVYTIRDQSGKEWAVWTWHTVLKNELVGKVQAGDFVAIHYRGKRPRQDGGGEYAAYRVAIDKSERQPPSTDDEPEEHDPATAGFPEGY